MTFEGDTAPFDEIEPRLRDAVLSQTAEAQKKFSPLLWAIPLVLLGAVGYWIAQRVVEHRRVDAYVAALREQPGIVVMGAERHDGKWLVSGLRDPLATQPAILLAPAKLDPARIVGRWEPYQALHPAIMLKRLQATLSPPPTISLSQDADGIRASGSAPQHWMDKARAFITDLARRRAAGGSQRPEGCAGCGLHSAARRHPGPRHSLRAQRAAARGRPGDASSTPSLPNCAIWFGWPAAWGSR